MDKQIFEALQGILSAEANTRMRSELNLKQLELNVEYSLVAASIALENSVELAVRQVALVHIRGYISRHWSIGAAKYEEGPIPDQRIKAQVREKVMAILASNDNRKLRLAAAAVVASMAKYDWPDEWPQLFSNLVELLHSNNRDQVHAALSVFVEWVNSDMTDQHMEQIGSLLPQLKHIFVEATQYSMSTRAMAVRVFGDCIEIISNLYSVQKEFVDAHAPAILGEWIPLIADVLAQAIPTDGSDSPVFLKTESIKAVLRATEGFSKHMAPFGTALLEALWKQLKQILDPFQYAFVYDDSPQNDVACRMLECQDDDGEAHSIDGYLLSIFEWLSKAAETRSMRNHFVEPGSNQPTEFFKQLLVVSLGYAQITADMLADWSDDMDLFVADEDEEGYRFNVRVSVQELLLTFSDNFSKPLVSALGWAAQERSALSRQWREQQQQHEQEHATWWLVSEATLWAIGSASAYIIEQQKQNTNHSLDLGALFDSDVWPLAHSAKFPFGQGRAFIFASSIAPILPREIAASFAEASSRAVADTQLHPAVRLSAVRAAGNLCRHLDNEVMKPHQNTIINGLAAVIPHLSEDSAHIALDAMFAALRVDQAGAASSEEVISQMAIGVWRKFPGDVLLTSIVIDIFEAMAANTHASESFAQRALPAIGAAITQEANDPMAVSSGIDLLAALVKGCPSPLPAGFTEAVLPSLMQVLLNTADSEILQSGQSCLKCFVQKDPERIAKFCGADGQPLLHQIIRFVTNMLSPDASESSALFVGDLVAKIIFKCSSYLSPDVLAELARVLTTRLDTAYTASFCASLVPPYAQLAVRGPADLVNLLSSMHFDSSDRSGLEVVLSIWFKCFLDVQGYYSRKLSAVALTHLFLLQDQRIGSLAVQGDLIPNPANNGKIVTRSLSKTNPDQYTRITAPAKIIKLLLAEVELDVETMYARQSGAGIESTLGDVGDGEGWEDEPGDDEEPSESFGGGRYLSDLISSNAMFGSEYGDEGGNDDDDDDDDEVQADPIYSQDLNEALGAFFRQAVQSGQANNAYNFRSAIDPTLTAKERELLSRLC